MNEDDLDWLTKPVHPWVPIPENPSAQMCSICGIKEVDTLRMRDKNLEYAPHAGCGHLLPTGRTTAQVYEEYRMNKEREKQEWRRQNDMTFAPGQLLVIEEGEYSDFGYYGPFNVLKPFSKMASIDEWKQQRQGWDGATEFAAWLNKLGYIEDIKELQVWALDSW